MFARTKYLTSARPVRPANTVFDEFLREGAKAGRQVGIQRGGVWMYVYKHTAKEFLFVILISAIKKPIHSPLLN